jgi:hypothetical protein
MLAPQLQNDEASYLNALLRLFPAQQLSLLLFLGCRPLQQAIPPLVVHPQTMVSF